MADTWRPKRTLAEVNALLCAPGTLHELETCIIDGRVQRVYKNQWPSVRTFWLWASELYADKLYIVFEKQRYTYQEVRIRSLKTAAIFNELYGVTKGDRVGICSRNYAEYLVIFWACHLLGAVPVLANAWLPIAPLVHCLGNTQCKLIVLDSERADRLEPEIEKLTAQAGAKGIVVLQSFEGKGRWNGMQPWETVFEKYKGDPMKMLKHDPNVGPEDNATIFFTSGTTGLPKGVLSTQRQFLTNALNTLVARRRAYLRRGEEIPIPSPEDPQPGVLISVPLFHVTGITSLTMTTTLGGGKITLMRKWDPVMAARLIRQEKLTSAGGVPSMAAEIIETTRGYNLESLTFGGAPAADIMTTRARLAFPNVTLSQGYGLTETNSIATSFAGDDYVARPSSCGLASPVNDILIMKDGKALPPGEIGEVFIRGPNVFAGYWRDPAATAKVLTTDGWFATGDLGLQDDEGFVYIRDRIKDIILRGGENIDSTTVENALFTEGVKEVAAVAVPDKRLGELVAAVVSVKSEYRSKLTEEFLVALSRTRLPRFAVPVIVLFQPELPHNPAGKIIKAELREFARREWQKRGKAAAKL
ncbi:long-chain-fatty-acid-CoA ligase [Mycena filopes]|nr:long-chain-fatty-acid-CoA ligase [Mycena filopes]